MIIAEKDLSDAEAGAMFGIIMGTMLILCVAFVLIMQARQKYGVMPRGLRWIETRLPALWAGTKGLGARLFYGDVLKAREADRLKMEREDGMTPWWDDTAKQWRHGDVESITNQHGFVVARRPRDYVNRVATPGVAFDKEQSA